MFRNVFKKLFEIFNRTRRYTIFLILRELKQLFSFLNVRPFYTNVHANPYPHRGTRQRDEWNPFPEFLICCSISKRFYFQWKAFDLLNKMRYILWVVAPLEACDVTNKGRHLRCYQDLEIRLKLREMAIFLCLTWTITHKWALCMILATYFNFIVDKS